MAKQTVYDKDGKAYLVEAVDAREMVEFNGYTMEPKGNKKASDKKIKNDGEAAFAKEVKDGDKEDHRPIQSNKFELDEDGNKIDFGTIDKKGEKIPEDK